MLKDKWLFSLVLFTATMIAFAIVGGFKNYSPVPHWDMWEGTLYFFHTIQQGDYSIWWDQHNEHRIVLARILFWIDYKFFAGLSVFLTIVNYILVVFSCYIFWAFLRESHEKETSTRREKILGLSLISWLFLWTQEANFTWAFQSQFFLAQSIPLFALFWLTKSTTTGNKKYFLIACIFGILSIVTMANGVLALPLMLIYSIVMRQGRAKILVLFSLSAACLAAYFYHYDPPVHHGSLSTAIRENPVGLIHYTILYLGSPFNYLSGKGEFGKASAAVAGALLLIISAWIAFKEIIKKERSPKTVALLIFILYITGTAFGTAGGRLALGMEQALTSRYTTPSIMAFAALAIILIAGGPKGQSTWRGFSKRNTLIISIPFCALLLTAQAQAFKSMADRQIGRNASALSLALNIPDNYYLRDTFYNIDRALVLAKISRENNYSFFGNSPYSGLIEQIEKPFSTSVENTCTGSSIRLETIPSATPYLRIYGWVHESTGNKTPEFIRFVDENNLTIGFAVAGARREDKFNKPSKKVKYSSFVGYILARAAGHQITAFGSHPDCKVNIQVPSTILSISSGLEKISRDILGDIALKTSDIVTNEGWTGSDYQHTSVEKIHVLGSFVSSNADTGSIILRAKNGSKLFFRSGPSPGQQYIEVMDTGEKILLPAAIQWSLLEVSRPSYSGSFNIKISDAGSSWGEWSAIAIESN